MQATMDTVSTSSTTSKAMLWAGRILSAFAVLFLVMDGAMKVVNIQPVIDASALLGLPVELAPRVGILLLACVAIYLVPRTSILGAILLTGFLGGAMSLQMRVDSGLFSFVFPIIMGAMLWGGLYLRDEQLRGLIPLRR